MPEGDPAVDKASVYAERFRRVAPLVRARSNVRQGFLIQATIGHSWAPGLATPWQKVVWADGSTSYRFCPLGAGDCAHAARFRRSDRRPGEGMVWSWRPGEGMVWPVRFL